MRKQDRVAAQQQQHQERQSESSPRDERSRERRPQEEVRGSASDRPPQQKQPGRMPLPD